jgi:ubiquinone/menaquinone biosynthesis C-methylase UbiE
MKGIERFFSMLAGENRSETAAMGFYQDRILPHLVNVSMRNSRLAPYRERIVSQAEGRILEIGVGAGENLPLYTDRAREVLGLEPHPRLLNMASSKDRRVPAKLIEGFAESIPVDDSSIDTVVTTWTLCTIPDAAKALSEMRRVLKPGGQLLFVEHGLSPDESVRKWQSRLTPAWKKLAGGCHLNRPIAELIETAGFRISRLETGYMEGPKPMTFMYEGAARIA